MDELSVLIGGRAGDGIAQAGGLLAHLLARLGYRIYVDFDYPSLIRGGHNFSSIRASARPIGATRSRIDYLLALDQETADRHAGKLTDPARMLYDADAAKAPGAGFPLKTWLKEESAPDLTRNSCLIGAFARCAGAGWDSLEAVFRKEIPRELDVNLKLARRGFDAATPMGEITAQGGGALPLLTGNEACGLGLLAAGLDAFIAYPMTPSSSLLHFLAQEADEFGITVMHPESEIAVILMALGFAFAGKRAAVGTSGGGFCLMTEGISLAGMAELPVVVMVGQRPGPSTGLPTYTAQTEMQLVMNAGQGEFPRLVVAPGDPEEAFSWSAAALNIAWKFQIPAIILMDKTLCEGMFSFDAAAAGGPGTEAPSLWDGRGIYKRYASGGGGISPLAFPADPRAVIKVNSYEHDEAGITTEDPRVVKASQEKRLGKGERLSEELSRLRTVGVYGKEDAPVAVLCWGSTKMVCAEAAQGLGLRIIHVPVLAPFPLAQLAKALSGVEKTICVEHNATGQLARLAGSHGVAVGARIAKYDGRPFTLDELEGELRGLLR